MPISTRKVARTGPSRHSRAPKRRGRPAVHDEAWTKVTVVLFDRQIVALDRLTAAIRARTGGVLNRTQIIRALVDAVFDSRIDMTASRSESELTRRLAKQLGA